MNVYHATKLHRLMISDVVNIHLESNGITARIHPDSLQARGIDREPEPKLLPSESQQYREHGIISATMARVITSRARRAMRPGTEQENASNYWEQRKTFLGITPDMPPAQQLAQVLLKRHGSVERVPARYRQVLERSRERLPGLVQQPQPQTRIRTQAPTRTTDVLRRLQQLRQQGEEVATGKRLRVHLTDDREQGMSW